MEMDLFYSQFFIDLLLYSSSFICGLVTHPEVIFSPFSHILSGFWLWNPFILLQSLVLPSPLYNSPHRQKYVYEFTFIRSLRFDSTQKRSCWHSNVTYHELLCRPAIATFNIIIISVYNVFSHSQQPMTNRFMFIWNLRRMNFCKNNNYLRYGCKLYAAIKWK